MAYTYNAWELNVVGDSISASKPVDAEVHTPLGATVSTVVLNSVGGLEFNMDGHLETTVAAAGDILDTAGTEVLVEVPDLFTGTVFVLDISVDVLAAGAGTILHANCVQV